MTINELGNKLKEMYENAPKGNSVTMIHLFGIKYADEILNNNYSKKDIIKKSGISSSYLTELNKGVKNVMNSQKLVGYIGEYMFFQSGSDDIIFIDHETKE